MFIRSTLGEPRSNQPLCLRSPTRRTHEHMIQLQPHERIIRAGCPHSCGLIATLVGHSRESANPSNSRIFTEPSYRQR
jgi:hypothetical protein